MARRPAIPDQQRPPPAADPVGRPERSRGVRRPAKPRPRRLRPREVLEAEVDFRREMAAGQRSLLIQAAETIPQAVELVAAFDAELAAEEVSAAADLAAYDVFDAAERPAWVN